MSGLGQTRARSTARPAPRFAADGRSLLVVGNHLSSKATGSFGMSESLTQRLSAAGWRVFMTSSKTGRVARLVDMLRTVWKRRRDYSLAVVDVYSGPAFAWAEAVACALKGLGKPYVLTLHGGNLPAFATRWPGRVGRLLRGATAVTTPSAYLGEQLKSYRSDLVLIPNALDLQTYAFRHRERALPHLVWVRTFHDIYNPSLAPSVLAELRDIPDVRLAMTGRDKDGSKDRVARRAEELGVTALLSLREAVLKREVPERLQAGDIYLNTPRIDNTPVTVLEAMACGLCVVSTNVGGIPYILRDGENALLVPSDDAVAMARAARRLISDPELASRLSLNARKSVEAFDWSIVLPRWEALLEESLDR